MAIIFVLATGRTLKYRISATTALTTIDPLTDAGATLGEPLRTILSTQVASDAAGGSAMGVPPAAGAVEDNRIRCSVIPVSNQGATWAGTAILGIRNAVSLVPNVTIQATTAAGPDLIVTFEINPQELGPGMQALTI